MFTTANVNQRQEQRDELLPLKYLLVFCVFGISPVIVASCGTSSGTTASTPFSTETPSGGAGSAPTRSTSTGATSTIENGSRSIVDIESTRPGITLESVIIAPITPAIAAVILLEGGDGGIGVTGSANNPVIDSQGFLARNADAFAAQGLLVVLVGPPSDFPSGVELSYRISLEQSQDVAGVVAWVDNRASLPVWVVGMSLGTYSATNSAIRLNSSVDGFAICSASTAPTGGPLPNGILDMELSQIAMPALIVGHQDDACPGTPAVAVPTIASALTYASPISQKVFTGGSPTMSQPCGPKSPHGYFGIDDEVISYMSNIILSQ